MITAVPLLGTIVAVRLSEEDGCYCEDVPGAVSFDVLLDERPIGIVVFTPFARPSTRYGRIWDFPAGWSVRIDDVVRSGVAPRERYRLAPRLHPPRAMCSLRSALRAVRPMLDENLREWIAFEARQPVR